MENLSLTCPIYMLAPCYFGLWTPKWRKILPCGSADSARVAAPAGSCPGQRATARSRTAESS